MYIKKVSSRKISIKIPGFDTPWGGLYYYTRGSVSMYVFLKIFCRYSITIRNRGWVVQLNVCYFVYNY